MIYLHKILPLIFSPLILIIFLILLGLTFKLRKLSILGIIILVICSLPIFSNKLINYLEINFEPIQISEMDNADAIVVLSGMVKVIKNKGYFNYEFTDSVDRIIAGLNLFKNKKAPILILTRGKVPWSIGRPEGEYLKDFAINYGVPKENIFLTENVENTDQEAKSVKKLLIDDNAEIILVTSAFHMPRAKKIFEAANINIIPFPVDFKTNYSKFTVMDLIPSASSLNSTSNFVREMIGRLYYYLKY